MTKLVNRAKMYTPTVGTGTITLNAPAVGYQSFTDAGVVNGDIVRYAIEDGTAWEIGSGTYSASGTTITRNPTQSSNGGAAINLTGAAVVYGTATADDIMSLAAIAASKAITAVDGFVYDTSKDSDGGAWRKRTQGTSWYNETLNTATRGARREFPAVAVIVAEATKVTIYDGDDPSLPMWMVFIEGGANALWSNSNVDPTSVSFLNGIMCVGQGGTGAGGFNRMHFVEDTTSLMIETTAKYNVMTIAQRNRGGYLTTHGNFPAGLVNRNVNDIAMTVLPDAPIDPATGLQVPTIAVATAGGVSVIKDDGTVTDSASTLASARVSFDDQGNIWWCRYTSTFFLFYASVADYFAGDGFGDLTADGSASTGPLASGLTGLIAKGSDVFAGGNSAVGTARQGLYLSNVNQSLLPATSARALNALITSTYNTGWMNGAIKGAFLSDTSATALVGSGELVTNGTFDTDVSGWTAGNSATLSVASNTLRVTNGAAYNGYAYQVIATVVGKTYVVYGKIAIGTSLNPRLLAGTGIFSGNLLLLQAVGSGNYWGTFVATGTTTWITATNNNLTAGVYSDFDNISVKLADADRSVNNKGLIVNGTVTRTAVATGADLVAYSGFSSANYLEQPYNSALDFGTGDFCVMGWVTKAGAGNEFILDRQNGASSSTNRLNLTVTASSIGFRCDATLVSVSHTFTTGVRYFVAVARKSGVAYFYVNGGLVGSATQTGNVTDVSSSYKMTVGANGQSKVEAVQNLALLRISATAPTADQIAKIYNDEKVLFQDGAQATLAGTSDAVTSLAYDDALQELLVGTNQNTSVFRGLRRVETIAGGASVISASNGIRLIGG